MRSHLEPSTAVGAVYMCVWCVHVWTKRTGQRRVSTRAQGAGRRLTLVRVGVLEALVLGLPRATAGGRRSIIWGVV